MSPFLRCGPERSSLAEEKPEGVTSSRSGNKVLDFGDSGFPEEIQRMHLRPISRNRPAVAQFEPVLQAIASFQALLALLSTVGFNIDFAGKLGKGTAG